MSDLQRSPVQTRPRARRRQDQSRVTLESLVHHTDHAYQSMARGDIHDLPQRHLGGKRVRHGNLARRLWQASGGQGVPPVPGAILRPGTLDKAQRCRPDV